LAEWKAVGEDIPWGQVVRTKVVKWKNTGQVQGTIRRLIDQIRGFTVGKTGGWRRRWGASVEEMHAEEDLLH
jgi:hypothetical protein